MFPERGDASVASRVLRPKDDLPIQYARSYKFNIFLPVLNLDTAALGLNNEIVV